MHELMAAKIWNRRLRVQAEALRGTEGLQMGLQSEILCPVKNGHLGTRVQHPLNDMK